MLNEHVGLPSCWPAAFIVGPTCIETDDSTAVRAGSSTSRILLVPSRMLAKRSIANETFALDRLRARPEKSKEWIRGRHTHPPAEAALAGRLKWEE